MMALQQSLYFQLEGVPMSTGQLLFAALALVFYAL
jgi:hypothetical protein